MPPINVILFEIIGKNRAWISKAYFEWFFYWFLAFYLIIFWSWILQAKKHFSWVLMLSPNRLLLAPLPSLLLPLLDYPWPKVVLVGEHHQRLEIILKRLRALMGKIGLCASIARKNIWQVYGWKIFASLCTPCYQAGTAPIKLHLTANKQGWASWRVGCWKTPPTVKLALCGEKREYSAL